MRIAIDASRCTVSKTTGTEHYATQLIHHIIQENEARPTPHLLTLYFRDTPSEALFPPSGWVQYRIIPFRRAWSHLRFAWALWQDKPDIVFVPAHTLPFCFAGKAVVTLHDVGYRHFPQAHPLSQRLYLELTTRYSAMRASTIFADSHATAHDLTRFYGVSPHKMHVVYPAVSIPPITTDKPSLQAKYGIPARYFLFIGTLQPRKNIARLVQAFQQFQTQYPEQPVGLVLAGNKGWLFEEAWLKSVQNVVITGYIDEADKGALYHHAEALVFPSLYEGFGFPVLEAFGCDTPVIASNTSSLPELVGNGGLLVDPLDSHAIAQAMHRVITDKTMRQQLIQHGREQLARFSWQESAKQALYQLENA